MAALTADKLIERRPAGDRNFPVSAGVKIRLGAMVAVEVPGGTLRPARANPTDIIVGISRQAADNSAGLASAISCETEAEGVYAMVNSAGGDAIALTDIGKDCYAVDDQTVALTNGGATRCRAGKIQNVTERGVWVRFDQ